MEGIPAGEKRSGNEVRHGHPAPHQTLIKGKTFMGKRGAGQGITR